MLRRLNHAWRILATGFSFTVFGGGCLVLGGIVIPIVSFLSGNEENQRRRVRGVISLSFRFFFDMMHHLGLVRYRVEGREALRGDRSCLVIANHPSLIDVVSLISLYPNACCIVKKELWHNFFTKRVMVGAGYIPNTDPDQLLENCKRSMERGDVLIIFPEGTRTVPNQEIVLQRGAAHIALRLNCPVRVIQIRVQPSTLTKNRPWYRVPPKRSDFVVTAKEMLSVQEYNNSGIPMSVAARRLTARMRENIEVALGDA